MTPRWLKNPPHLLALALGLSLGMGPHGSAQAMSETLAPAEGASWSVEAGEGAIPSAPWWESFDDGSLGGIVTGGLAANYDLDAARHNLAQADAVLWQTRSALVPKLSAVVSTNLGPQEVLFAQFGGVPANVCDPESLDLPDGVEAPEPDGACRSFYYSGSALLQASYKLDLFGQSIAAVQASKFSAKASTHERDLFAMSLSSQIGEAYFDVVAAKQQLTLLQDQVGLNKTLLELTELRYETGQVQGLDVLQQRQQAAAAESRLPTAKAQLEGSYRRLAALTGHDPLSYRPETPSALPALPEAPGLGHPGELLQSRPDLRSAYDRLQVSQYQLRQARRAALPAVNVTAQAGYQWNDIGLGAGVTVLENVGAGFSVSVPLFQGGFALAGIKQASAAEQGKAAGFNQDVLQALSEVETLVSNEAGLAEQLTLTRRQAEAARLAFEESQNRYESGISTYVSMLTALNTYQAAELTAISVHRSLISTRIQLHLALGGEWTRGLGASKGEN